MLPASCSSALVTVALAASRSPASGCASASRTSSTGSVPDRPHRARADTTSRRLRVLRAHRQVRRCARPWRRRAGRRALRLSACGSRGAPGAQSWGDRSAPPRRRGRRTPADRRAPGSWRPGASARRAPGPSCEQQRAPEQRRAPRCCRRCRPPPRAPRAPCQRDAVAVRLRRLQPDPAERDVDVGDVRVAFGGLPQRRNCAIDHAGARVGEPELRCCATAPDRAPPGLRAESGARRLRPSRP